VDDSAALNARLEAAGFTVVTPREFESNVLYDTPDRAMRARTEILRIRNYAGRWTVTHKRIPDSGVARTGTNTAWRPRPRWPTARRWRRYFSRWDWWRHSATKNGAASGTDGEGHCVVDETPIGNFAELEGSAEWIDRTAARLRVDPLNT